MTETTKRGQGPLAGLRVLEVGGVGPGPFCTMMLSDMGAEVIRIDRKHAGESGLPIDRKFEVAFRGKRSVALDLKKGVAVEAVRRMVARADVVVEGFRPGVMERLGLGPDTCLEINPRLVYGRMTGWGQDGPMAKAAGHDLNYIALSGALHAIGRKDGPPEIPLNLIGDFGGGSMYLAFGIMCALHEARSSGKGQVVDAAMIDGSTSLMGMIYGMFAAGYWKDERGSNRLDSGAPWYDVYETKDGKWVAVGSTEHTFYLNTMKVMGLKPEDFSDQHDRAGWPAMKAAFTRVFKTRTRDEWVAAFDGTETCFSPVLSLAEAPTDPHQRARGNFVEVAGVTQPAPAPRFSRSQGAVQGPPPEVGEHTDEVLREWGFQAEELQLLRQAGGI
ncbi:MAG TPA: CaiB/BaiF CoA-transferase family protein [Ramlibacter sp.]|nr:CaiB/BaiF CoA-transferase family protein [Ramlibacter sp.]